MGYTDGASNPEESSLRKLRTRFNVIILVVGPKGFYHVMVGYSD